MFFKPKNKEENRYYLLPGMGKANRQKRALYMWCSIAVGLVISAIVALVIYAVQSPRPFWSNW
ncbi:MAG: hypothetical protein ACO1QB_07235 [Verrucomicrobiales bacterium]